MTFDEGKRTYNPLYIIAPYLSYAAIMYLIYSHNLHYIPISITARMDRIIQVMKHKNQQQHTTINGFVHLCHRNKNAYFAPNGILLTIYKIGFKLVYASLCVTHGFHPCQSQKSENYVHVKQVFSYNFVLIVQYFEHDPLLYERVIGCVESTCNRYD